jgi:hypothetical protein
MSIKRGNVSDSSDLKLQNSVLMTLRQAINPLLIRLIGKSGMLL